MSNANGEATAHDASVTTDPPAESNVARIEIGDWVMEAPTKKELLAKIADKETAADQAKDDNAAARKHWDKARKLAEEL